VSRFLTFHPTPAHKREINEKPFGAVFSAEFPSFRKEGCRPLRSAGWSVSFRRRQSAMKKIQKASRRDASIVRDAQRPQNPRILSGCARIQRERAGDGAGAPAATFLSPASVWQQFSLPSVASLRDAFSEFLMTEGFSPRWMDVALTGLGDGGGAGNAGLHPALLITPRWGLGFFH
jgi:hypothetical protein